MRKKQEVESETPALDTTEPLITPVFGFGCACTEENICMFHAAEAGHVPAMAGFSDRGVTRANLEAYRTHNITHTEHAKSGAISAHPNLLHDQCACSQCLHIQETLSSETGVPGHEK